MTESYLAKKEVIGGSVSSEDDDIRAWIKIFCEAGREIGKGCILDRDEINRFMEGLKSNRDKYSEKEIYKASISDVSLTDENKNEPLQWAKTLYSSKNFSIEEIDKILSGLNITWKNQSAIFREKVLKEQPRLEGEFYKDIEGRIPDGYSKESLFEEYLKYIYLKSLDDYLKRKTEKIKN